MSRNVALVDYLLYAHMYVFVMRTQQIIQWSPKLFPSSSVLVFIVHKNMFEPHYNCTFICTVVAPSLYTHDFCIVFTNGYV